MELTGRVAVITGARRVGASVARALASRGADIVLSFRTGRAEAEEVAGAVRDAGRRAILCQADVSDPDECRRLIETAARELGRVDVLVNMASRYERRPFDTLTDADLDAALAVDLRAAYACALAAAAHMQRSGGGRIINFSDWVARSGRPRYPGYLPYYVAKTAVIGLTEALALELASSSVLVNAIAPGPILPPAGLPEEEYDAVSEATPLGRWGGADEIAKAVLALVESDFITGETIRVDGGRHIR
jgi:NAD(P)-dependent dehydrogenase (short-subunit alcohol dehydrogenase family)